MSKHKRHIKTLNTLFAAGWTVEACYWKRTGCAGELDCSGRPVFWSFSELSPKRAFRTPPILTGGQLITFVVVNNLPPVAACHRIVGWRALSKFAVQERQKKIAKECLNEGEIT